MSRGAWILGLVGLAFIAALMSWMGKTLDTKAPIRIDRVSPNPTPADEPEPVTPEEAAAAEEAAMRALVRARAVPLAARAAAQIFPSSEAGRAVCTFTGASPVHRDTETAWWNAEFSCVDREQPGALPNPTSVSVRLRRDGTRWTVED